MRRAGKPTPMDGMHSIASQDVAPSGSAFTLIVRKFALLSLAAAADLWEARLAPF